MIYYVKCRIHMYVCTVILQTEHRSPDPAGVAGGAGEEVPARDGRGGGGAVARAARRLAARVRARLLALRLPQRGHLRGVHLV